MTPAPGDSSSPALCPPSPSCSCPAWSPLRGATGSWCRQPDVPVARCALALLGGGGLGGHRGGGGHTWGGSELSDPPWGFCKELEEGEQGEGVGGLATGWEHFPPSLGRAAGAGRAGDPPTPHLHPGTWNKWARAPHGPRDGGRREPQGPAGDGRGGEATTEPPSLSKGLFQACRDRRRFPVPARARGGGEKKQPHGCPQPSGSAERVY